MKFQNPFARQQPAKPIRRTQENSPPKKPKCKIKIKKKGDEETFEFANCKPEEIEAFKQIRKERQE